MNDDGKILITGGAGFIGSHVVRCFCKKGIFPTCYVKKTTDATYLPLNKIDICYGDILNLNDLAKAMQGVDTIIHIASKVSDWGSKSDFYRTNIEGTLNVLKAGHMAGVKYFIITGSISSYGEENSNGVKDESFPFNSHYPYFMDCVFPCRMNFYRDSKAISTQKAIRFAQEHQLNLTILEPVWVFGEREFNTGFYQYLRTVKNGLPFFPGSSGNNFPVIYVRDLARAYYLAYHKKLSGIHRFIIGNQSTYKMKTVLHLFCKALKVKPPIHIPLWIVYPLALMLESIATVLCFNKPPVLTRGRVKMYYDNVEFSSAKANEVLSFKNDFSLADAIHRTVRWYRVNHFI